MTSVNRQGCNRQKSHVSAGPSNGEWETHKATIIGLYKESKVPLREVRRVMERAHGFHASKRMYDRRFEKWNISKNLKKAEKEQILGLYGKDTIAPPLDPTVWAKVRRYQRDQLKHQRRKADQASCLDLTSCASSGVSEASSCTLDDDLDIWPTSSPGDPSTPCDTPTNSSQPSFSNHPHQAMKVLLSEDVFDLQSGHNSSRSDFATNASSQLPPPTIVNLETKHMAIVLQSIRSCCNIQLQTHINCRLVVSPTLVSAIGLFWSDVKTAIYLTKFPSPTQHRHAPAINQACDSIFRLSQNNGELLASYHFVWNLISTLSPVNTWACPEIRTLLLRYISGLASIRLSVNHPTAVLCRELLSPNVQGRQACNAALQCAIDVFGSSLGITATQTVDLQRKKIDLLRRDGHFEEAVDAARLLRSVTVRECGVTSDQGVAAARALAHVLMREENYLEARDVCLSIIAPKLIGSVHLGNSAAVHTMEDIAEIDCQLGEMMSAIFWLGQAAEAGSCCWGESIATVHIQEKLREVTLAAFGVAE